VIFNAEVERSLLESFEDGETSSRRVHPTRTLAKRETDDLISDLANRYGAQRDRGRPRQDQGARLPYATEGGITISKNDIASSRRTSRRSSLANESGRERRGPYERGLITEESGHEQS
jgi:hypothetical protein